MYLQSQDDSTPHIWTGTVDDYALLTGHRPSATVRDALASGKAVSLWPEYAHDGAVQIDTFHDQTWESMTTTSGTGRTRRRRSRPCSTCSRRGSRWACS
ncbi:hypothetical protein P9139_02470 [Curtobacterium flaccumfaciens]|nr:hypothetical protein P9139_02470 [Curtobacterium flaccumfaciens]